MPEVLESKELFNAGMLESSGVGLSMEYAAPVMALDYAKFKIVMEAGNIVETAYRLKACDKEPWTIAFIESCPAGSWFVDIGASTGPYTLVAIANQLSVIAIEPSFPSYNRLCRNLARNHVLDRAIVVCAGVGKTLGFDWLNYYDLRAGAGSNRIGDAGKKTWHRQLVPVYPLDWLIQLINPSTDIYVKLDVDGDEADVLAGAVETLRNPQVKGLMVEVPKKTEQSLIDLFATNGLMLVNKFDQRAGQPIGAVWYGEFRRGS